MDHSIERKSNKTLIIVATVIVSLFTVLACCGGFFVLAMGEDEPLTDQERALFITPEVLGESIGANFGERPELIQYTKNKSMGITTLTLEYDSPEDAEVPFYLNHEITYEPSVQDARDTIAISRLAITQGATLMAGEGAEFSDAEHLYQCCDQSLSQVLSMLDESGERVEVGHLFMMRAGAITMTLWYVGFVSHDAEAWRDLLEPTFAAIVRARPKN